MYQNGPIKYNGKSSELSLEQAQILCDVLKFDMNLLDDQQRRRIFEYYLPVLQWIIMQSRNHSKTSDEALVVGISAPQGSGKSTLVSAMQSTLNKIGYEAIDISIDDFYLTRKEHENLNEVYPENQLYQVRGNAGTHDVELGIQVLQDLKSPEAGEVKVPRYNKAAYEGKGDRYHEEQWNTVKRPLKVILLEGWMLGFQQLSQEAIEKVTEKDLITVNKYLAKYEEWDQLVDSWLIVKVQDAQWVYDWRAEAEVKMRESGKKGMTDEQIKNFVSKYMPAYETYLPILYKHGPPVDQTKDNVLIMEIDKNRNPVKEFELN